MVPAPHSCCHECNHFAPQHIQGNAYLTYIGCGIFLFFHVTLLAMWLQCCNQKHDQISTVHAGQDFHLHSLQIHQLLNCYHQLPKAHQDHYPSFYHQKVLQKAGTLPKQWSEQNAKKTISHVYNNQKLIRPIQ
jgi:hypothetical protein